MKRCLFLSFALLVSGADLPAAETTLAASTPDRARKLFTLELDGRDLRFLTDALELGAQQTFLYELAASRVESEQLKGLANVLQQTQATENQMLVRLAESKGIYFNKTETAARKALTRKLAKLTGPKLDKAWLELVTSAVQAAIDNCEAVFPSRDSDIRSFAEKALLLSKEKLLVINRLTGTNPPAATPPARPTPSFRTAPAQLPVIK